MLHFVIKGEDGFTIAITTPTPHNFGSKAFKTELNTPLFVRVMPETQFTKSSSNDDHFVVQYC